MERQVYLRLVAECRELARQQVALDDAIGQVNPEHYRQHREQLDALSQELHRLTHRTHVTLWPILSHFDDPCRTASAVACVLACCFPGASVGTAQGRTDRLWQVHLCAPLCAELDAREVVAEAVRRGIAVTAYRGLVEAVA